MNPRRLALLIGLPLVVVAVVLVYIWPRQVVEEFRGIPPPLLAQVPPGATAIIYADLTALRASPSAQQLSGLFSAAEQDPEYLDFVRTTGFDYTRDLNRAVIAVWPGTPPRVLAMGEGRFDRERIASYALRSGKLEQLAGREIYVIPSAGNTPEIRFSFPSQYRIALVQNAGNELFPVAGGAAPIDPTMNEKVRTVSGSAVFAVCQLNDHLSGLNLGGWRSSQLDSILHGVRWLTLAAQPRGAQLKVTAQAECDSVFDAGKLSGTLEGLRLLGRMALTDPRMYQQIQPPQAAALLDHLLRTAVLSRDGKRVALQLELNSEILRRPTGPSPSQPPH